MAEPTFSLSLWPRDLGSESGFLLITPPSGTPAHFVPEQIKVKDFFTRSQSQLLVIAVHPHSHSHDPSTETAEFNVCSFRSEVCSPGLGLLFFQPVFRSTSLRTEYRTPGHCTEGQCLCTDCGSDTAHMVNAGVNTRWCYKHSHGLKSWAWLTDPVAQQLYYARN